MDKIGNVPGFLAKPKGETKGTLIVIHEIWGLNPHIEDITKRFANEGYLSFAPDLFANAGLDPELGAKILEIHSNGTEEERTKLQPMFREWASPIHSPEYAHSAIASLKSIVDELLTMPDVNNKVAVTGFCFGGSYSFALAASDPRIKASIPFYGQPPAVVDIANIKCPILAFYGETDSGITDGVPELIKEMKAVGVDFNPVIFPNVGHAFFSDTNKTAYDEKSAKTAWEGTLEFLNQHL